ncbi:MAG TPA: GxxExxY protein [Saprospiraceae bacterium]|nr:GxxExxY protein [Saprospiraceae bacterium]HNT19028.1 GxxExxY protein [Saprospiraceae bacterium]
MTENELAKIVVDICYRIHTELGPGLLESIYEAAFVYELEHLGIPYTRQEIINVVYKGQVLGPAFKSDIILENKLIVELKSVERLENVHHKVVLNYMKLKNIKLGFLINFNVALIKDGIHRKILGQLED